MKPPDQKFLVFKNQTLRLPNVAGGKPTIPSQPHRLEPELAFAVRRTDVDVGRLVGFLRVEVKTEWTNP